MKYNNENFQGCEGCKHYLEIENDKCPYDNSDDGIICKNANYDWFHGNINNLLLEHKERISKLEQEIEYINESNKLDIKNINLIIKALDLIIERINNGK